MAFIGATPVKLDLGDDMPRVAALAKECGLFLVDWCTTTIVCDGS